MFISCVGCTYPLVHKSTDEDEDTAIVMTSLLCILIGWFVPIFVLTAAM